MVFLVNDVPLSEKIHAFQRRCFQVVVTHFRFHRDPGENRNTHILDDALLDGFGVEHVLYVAELHVVGI